MAQKKKEGSGCLAVFFLLWAILALLALVAPFAIFIAWIYFEIRCIKFPKVETLDAFALTSSEEKVLKDHITKFYQYDKERKKLERSGRNLSRRKDGSYDERSSHGRDLNTLKPKLEEAREKVLTQQALPLQRLHKWSFNRSGRYAFRIAVVGYLLIGCLLYVIKPQWVQNISKILSDLSWLKIFSNEPILYGVTISAMVIMTVIIAPVWWLKSESMETNFDGYEEFVKECGEEEDEEEEEEEDEEEDEDKNKKVSKTRSRIKKKT